MSNDSYPDDGGDPAILFNWSTSSTERQRTPTWFSVVNVAGAGITNLHTPAAGKRFRLLGGYLVISPVATTGGGSIIELRDGATTRIVAPGYLGTAANTQSGAGPIILKANGYLSSAINTNLNVNLTAGLTAGEIVISVWGNDE